MGKCYARASQCSPGVVWPVARPRFANKTNDSQSLPYPTSTFLVGANVAAQDFPSLVS